MSNEKHEEAAKRIVCSGVPEQIASVRMNTKSKAEQIRAYLKKKGLYKELNAPESAELNDTIDAILSQGSEPSVDEVVGELKDILKYSGKDFQANKENQHKFLNLINEIASKLLKRLEKK